MTHKAVCLSVHLSVRLSVCVSVSEHVLPQTGVHKANFHTENGILSVGARRVIAKRFPQKKLLSSHRFDYSVDLLGEESMSDVMTPLDYCITANSILAHYTTKRSYPERGPESNRTGRYRSKCHKG